jgi:hypothetical protein
MSRLWIVIAACLFCCAACRPSEPEFAVLEVHVDAGAAQLAAYQLELRMEHAEIVGVEGGDGAFAEPPQYDPAALRQGRIVIASFTLGDAPSGRVLVARLHVMATSRESYSPLAVVAARPGGERIEVEVTVERVE